MELRELKKLVAQGEGLTVEFKRKAAHPDKIMREVVAFANTVGGFLLIGVDDDGSLPGLKYPDEDAFVLKNAIAKYCQPAVEYELKLVPVAPNRKVLVFHIKPGVKKPVFVIYNFRKRRGRAYVRVADRSVQASREMRQILKWADSPQQVGFTYGERERILLKYLAQYEKINVATFAQLADTSYQEASQLLVRLTLAHVLQIIPDEAGDYFIRKPEAW
ncbi:MAG: ATP-binding protein [Cytophagales bacterium]|nr:ATP-binding protein [Bernardetiaceae bacterium]MDW8203794.1 ATP-binding protein [Cytophagales bacterium]